MLIRDVFFGLRGVFGPSQIYMTDHDTLGHKLAAFPDLTEPEKTEDLATWLRRF